MCFLAGFLIIFWDHFASYAGTSYEFVIYSMLCMITYFIIVVSNLILFIYLVFCNATYSTSMTIINSTEIILSMGMAMLLSFISFYILGNQNLSDHHSPYYGTLLVFFFSFVLTSADKYVTFFIIYILNKKLINY